MREGVPRTLSGLTHGVENFQVRNYLHLTKAYEVIRPSEQTRRLIDASILAYVPARHHAQIGAGVNVMIRARCHAATRCRTHDGHRWRTNTHTAVVGCYIRVNCCRKLTALSCGRLRIQLGTPTRSRYRVTVCNIWYGIDLADEFATAKTHVHMTQTHSSCNCMNSTL